MDSRSTKNRGISDLLVLCKTFVTFLTSKMRNSSSLFFSSMVVDGCKFHKMTRVGLSSFNWNVSPVNRAPKNALPCKKYKSFKT